MLKKIVFSLSLLVFASALCAEEPEIVIGFNGIDILRKPEAPQSPVTFLEDKPMSEEEQKEDLEFLAQTQEILEQHSIDKSIDMHQCYSDYIKYKQTMLVGFAAERKMFFITSPGVYAENIGQFCKYFLEKKNNKL